MSSSTSRFASLPQIKLSRWISGINLELAQGISAVLNLEAESFQVLSILMCRKVYLLVGLFDCLFLIWSGLQAITLLASPPKK